MKMYVFLLIVIIYLFISFNVTKRDWAFPSNIVLGMYIISICFFISESNTWGIDIGNTTFSLLILGITTYTLVGIIVFIIFSKVSIRKENFNYDYVEKENSTYYADINPVISCLLIIFEVIGFIAYFKNVRNHSLMIGSYSSLSEMIGNYRDAGSLGDAGTGLSSFSLNSYRLMTALAYIYMGIIVQFLVAKKKSNFVWKILHFTPIIIFIACSLLTGGRNPIIQLFLAFIIMYYVKYKQLNKNKKLSKKATLKIIVGLVLALISFSIFRGVVGRTSTYSTWDYLAIYIGAPIKLFDLFLKNGGGLPHFYIGQETFSNLWESFGFNIPSHSNLEFRVFNNWALGNVYTPFRRYYSDFGVWGIIILTSIEALFYSLYYLIIKKKKFNPYILDVTTLIYSYLAIGPFYYSVVERFYLLWSKNTLIIILEIYVLAKILTKFKLKKYRERRGAK
ncbi:oligosaccharide repeat unit polymerase [Lactobacillus sp. PV037]|uniref:O-antigen polymerase n=1 Tax=Lactobacillus sp. PV037 TaxID=2594496 RepID=UPI00223F5BCA|nr:O-antigen polymerase [Lactobacillus sp. PV037]QNQ83112.1 oligosaccharide repeat unit polymerase [Lactobacillus sp. PV037]